jgi:phosphatidylserine decarboxylase
MIAEMQIPRLLRRPIFTAYSKVYRVNLKEVELPLRDYPTFCSFFTRRIKRPLPEAQPNTVSSPCDGKVLVVEEVTGDKCQTIKGCKYSLSELVTGQTQADPAFIGDNLKINKHNKLFQLVIYLAPGDYHRFHSPTNLDILRRTHIDGRCDSVSERTLSKGKPIYEKNGRVTVTAKWQEGLMTMVMVGALNVMRIDITEKDHLARGEELGMFNLGSTIIMIVEARDLKDWKVQPGQKIKFGEPLFEFLTS